MIIDIKSLPFSKYGSYVSVTLERDLRTFVIRNCRQLFGDEKCMEVYFTDKLGNPLTLPIQTFPSHIQVGNDELQATIWLRNDEELMISVKGMSVYVDVKAGWCFKVSEQAYRFQRVTNYSYTTSFVVLEGIVEPDIVTEVKENFQQQTKTSFLIQPNDAHSITCGIHISPYEGDYQPQPISLESELQKTKELWEQFNLTCPPVSLEYQSLASQLWFNLWSSVIRARGNLKYDAMLMSKSTMCAVWPWDHCFNALALLAGGQTKLALDQFFIPFELQTPEGKLPDLINTEIQWRANVKPPIHGWCFAKFMDKMTLSQDILVKAYDHLTLWTNWHFRFRDTDHDGIPEYMMGNDSGWDNSTVFDIGSNIESPDLPAYLYVQMKTLARIAKTLGDDEGARQWLDRAMKLKEDLIQHSWMDNTFVAKVSGTHHYEQNPTSLLTLMPIIMGKDLPQHIAHQLVQAITAHHLTDYGIATESIHSSKYESNGYWRGPIWAPTTYLVIDSLRDAGYTELARQIADHFCKTVSKSGSYENYDALTGEGLWDRGYTWSSSAALCLMHEFHMDKGGETDVM